MLEPSDGLNMVVIVRASRLWSRAMTFGRFEAVSHEAVSWR